MPEQEDRSSWVEKELFLRSLQVTRVGRATGVSLVADAMASRMQTMAYPAGAVLYKEGEAAHRVYFIKRGQVELRKDGEAPWTFREREIVGVLDVMMDRARGRTAVAATDTVTLAVTADDWLELLEDNFEVTRTAIANVARGVHELTLQISPTGGFAPPTADDTVARPIRPLDTVERIIALRDAPLLAKVSVQSLADLAAVLEARRLDAGDRLFRRVEPSNAFFLVARGLIEITRADPPIRAGFGPGDVVGGCGAVALTQQAFEAVAQMPSLVYRVGIEEYFDLMEDHFELARSLLALMASVREDLMRRVADLVSSAQ